VLTPYLGEWGVNAQNYGIIYYYRYPSAAARCTSSTSSSWGEGDEGGWCISRRVYS